MAKREKWVWEIGVENLRAAYKEAIRNKPTLEDQERKERLGKALRLVDAAEFRDFLSPELLKLIS